MSQQATSLFSLTLMLTTAVSAAHFVTPLGAAAGAGENALGVARTDGSAGERIAVDVLGTAIVEAGAAVAIGATLKVDADGRAIAWATSGAKVGLALQAATAAGQWIEVLLIQNVA
jgi:hypothetical protein